MWVAEATLKPRFTIPKRLGPIIWLHQTYTTAALIQDERHAVVFWLFFLHFLKIAQAGGRTWDFFWFSFIFSHKQRLRPLGNCAPLFFFISMIMQQATS